MLMRYMKRTLGAHEMTRPCKLGVGGRREERGVIEKQQIKRLHEMLMRVLIVSPDNETNRPWVRVGRELYETMTL